MKVFIHYFTNKFTIYIMGYILNKKNFLILFFFFLDKFQILELEKKF